MKVKDVWYFHYAQEESEILQPELVMPESHVGIYCEAEEVVFPVSFHIWGFCKGEVMFEKEVMVSGNGDDEDVSVRCDAYGQCSSFVKRRTVSRIGCGLPMRWQERQRPLKRNVSIIRFPDRYRILTESLSRRW